jgi:HSP20 family protein
MATFHPFGLAGGIDAVRELRRIRDEMDRLMGAAPSPGGRIAAAGGFPAVNLYAGHDGVALVAELPGVDKEDLEIQAHRDTLTLRGRRRSPVDDAQAFHRRERGSGSFTRTIQLPYRVDPERIGAHLENGVLRLSLPRPEEDKPRRIAVNG